MLKKLLFILMIVSIVLIGAYFLLFYTDKSYDGKEIYPLYQIANSEEKWVLNIAEVGTNKSINVSDWQILYNNKYTFKITFEQDVYMSTPKYFVRIFKNKKEIKNYPLLTLEQIEFGTIDKSIFNERQ